LRERCRNVGSRRFQDLRGSKILHTRFARLVLGVAVLEDIVLWLALAVATALAGKTVLNPRQMSYHLLTTIAFFGLGLTIVPRIVKRLNKSKFNVFRKTIPGGVCDRRSARLLRGGWVLDVQSGLCRFPRGVCCCP